MPGLGPPPEGPKDATTAKGSRGTTAVRLLVRQNTRDIALRASRDCIPLGCPAPGPPEGGSYGGPRGHATKAARYQEPGRIQDQGGTRHQEPGTSRAESSTVK